MIVQVRAISTDADFRALIEFPWTIYKNDPSWTPSLMNHRVSLLTSHPAWDYLYGQHFGAWRDGHLCGTVTAFVNPKHNERFGEQIGWFGGFECEDNLATAHALLAAAAAWCRQQGMRAIRGPATYTLHEPCGLLIDGFTPPPPIAMSYNLPYYPQLLAQSEYQKVMDTFEVRWTRASNFQKGLRRIQRLAARQQAQSDIRVEATPRQQFFAVFRDLYEACWADNWGFVPITQAELAHQRQQLNPFLQPQMTTVAYAGERPVGFLVSVPDIHAALRQANPRPGLPDALSQLRTLWHWKIGDRVREARVALMGILPAYRTGRVAALMLAQQMPYIEQHYDVMSASWILETNADMLRICAAVGGEVSRTYRFYQKVLPVDEPPLASRGLGQP